MDDRPLYNSRIFANFVDYIEKNYPHVNIPALLAVSGIDPLELADPGHWFTQRHSDTFAVEAAKATGNPHIARDVGRNLAFANRNKSVRQYILGMLEPAVLFGIIGRSYHMLSRAATLTSRRLDDCLLEVVSTPTAGVTEEPSQCENRQGSFESIMRLLTGEWPSIEHPECIHQGHKRCRYIITWQSPSWRFLQLAASYWLLVGGLGAAIACIFLPAGFWPHVLLGWGLIAFLLMWLNSRTQLADLASRVKQDGTVANEAFDELQTRHANILLVHEISMAISGFLETKQLLQGAAELIYKQLDFDRVVVLLPNEQQSELRHVAFVGFDDAAAKLVERHVFPIDGPTPISRAYREKMTITVDSSQASDFPLPTDLNVARQIKLHSLVCVPIFYEDRSFGVLALDKCYSKRDVTESEVRVLSAIASQLAIAMVNADAFSQLEMLNEVLSKEVEVRQRAEKELKHHQLHLEELVDERTSELRAAQSRLIETSRIAGKYEVASGIVHNVGNVLNSLSVATDLLREQFRTSHFGRFQQAVALLEEHTDDLAGFLSEDPRGQKLPEYLVKITQWLADERDIARSHINTLCERLGHIKRIIATQQTYATDVVLVRERFMLADVVRMAIAISKPQEKGIQFECDLGEKMYVYSDRHLVLQIITNLVVNAIEATCAQHLDRRPPIRITAQKSNELGVVIEVADSGVGIASADLFRVFQHGFSAKENGDGFGLHTSALAAKQLGGSLAAYSDGLGQGARFVFILPEESPTSDRQ